MTNNEIIIDLEQKLEAAYNQIHYWMTRAHCAETAMFDLISGEGTFKDQKGTK